MKKINIVKYKVSIPTNEGIIEQNYDVVGSIENVMLANGNITSQKLTMLETLKKARIAEKIKASKDKGFVLLEDSEFNEVERSFKAFSGFGKNEVELCKRIEEVETVDVEEKKKK